MKLYFFRFFLLVCTAFHIIACSGGSRGSKANTDIDVLYQVKFTMPEGAVPIIYRGHIYISGKIDSIAGNFIFDTGACGLYLDNIFY